ncbi:class I SAM-dependent methyltransferase [Chelatococcus reniformis]|uniref:class I SAM-dependent methyltransferase n=1 Tax=Chelatococcus reniformis TaxID=1494448 RepID=UPI0016643EBC|nr:class I SAM-dependent methyltransferase [Chelatococcus reniformis]
MSTSSDNSVLDLRRYPVLPESHLRRSRVVSDRNAALALWPKNAVIAEVGVALGGFSEAILTTCRPSRFLAIDRFDLHELPELWGAPITDHFGNLTHAEFYRKRFSTEIEQGLVHLLKGDSAAVISTLPDASVDLFYVDADHTYEGVWRDLEAILPKVKPDGWIVMNDYIPAETGLSNEPYGVIQATNEFMVKHGWEMIYFALAYVMYCDVGLRRL